MAERKKRIFLDLSATEDEVPVPVETAKKLPRVDAAMEVTAPAVKVPEPPGQPQVAPPKTLMDQHSQEANKFIRCFNIMVTLLHIFNQEVCKVLTLWLISDPQAEVKVRTFNQYRQNAMAFRSIFATDMEIHPEIRDRMLKAIDSYGVYLLSAKPAAALKPLTQQSPFPLPAPVILKPSTPLLKPAAPMLPGAQFKLITPSCPYSDRFLIVDKQAKKANQVPYTLRKNDGILELSFSDSQIVLDKATYKERPYYAKIHNSSKSQHRGVMIQKLAEKCGRDIYCLTNKIVGFPDMKAPGPFDSVSFIELLTEDNVSVTPLLTFTIVSA